jgi:hypothetical protein
MRCEVVRRDCSLRKAAAPKEEAKSREVLSECGFWSRIGRDGCCSIPSGVPQLPQLARQKLPRTDSFLIAIRNLQLVVSP